MTELYTQMIGSLTTYFVKRMIATPEIVLTKAEFQKGTDCLNQKCYKDMVKEAFDYYLDLEGYELSYNQMSTAFFNAAKEVEKLIII
jgi:hypothetical protein